MKVTNIKYEVTHNEPPNPPVVSVIFEVRDDEGEIITTARIDGINLTPGPLNEGTIKRMIAQRARAIYDAEKARRAQLEAAKANAELVTSVLEQIEEIPVEEVLAPPPEEVMAEEEAEEIEEAVEEEVNEEGIAENTESIEVIEDTE